MSAEEATEAKRLAMQAAKLREEISNMEAEIKAAKPQQTAVPVEEPKAVENAEIMEKEISDTMKDKLRRELISQGADPNRSSGNGILIVAAVIGVLVLLGGQGIFFTVPYLSSDVQTIMSEAFSIVGSINA